MKISSGVAAILLCMSASALAQKGYKAAKDPEAVGYSSTTGADGRITITYTGAKGAAPDQVSKLAMLRAAELTASAGKEWFAVIRSQTQPVSGDSASDLRSRTGPDFATGSVSSAAGGSVSQAGTPPGVGDAAVPSGPTTGGFGGGDVPYQVLERWRPTQSARTTLVIQMGSGTEASFPGLAQQPTIYAAADVIEQVRGKPRR